MLATLHSITKTQARRKRSRELCWAILDGCVHPGHRDGAAETTLRDSELGRVFGSCITVI
jgi:hypothetical protein